ncbi:hypothetical protein CPB83DRAFT_852280 [Crepidotus variabilis]|uniref:Uncharacterized protein n=1 Tax=Crepidotus variabilis TaxID=179855 RepID=A0A9P6JQS6_9AGAR|nr:hypothetical protein CPB83DRAFT_852280 [Crepidotus variabilis]
MKVAFGKPNINYDPAKVQEVAQAMKTGTVTFQTARKINMNKDAVAHTYLNLVDSPAPGKPSWEAEKIEFTSTFFDESSAKERALAVTHEVSHATGGTGDNESAKKPNTVIRGPDSTDDNPAIRGSTGYFFDLGKVNSLADAESNTVFGGFRDRTKNMHDNADSYALAALLCSQLGKREFNDDQLEALMRRNSCPMPKKKFAKPLIHQIEPIGAAQSQPRGDKQRSMHSDLSVKSQVHTTVSKAPKLSEGHLSSNTV